jgi:hypothetical protein
MGTRLSHIEGFTSCFLCLLALFSTCGAVSEGPNDGLAAKPFANMEKAREYGHLYMSVDKKKMKHRRRILIEGMHPVFHSVFNIWAGTPQLCVVYADLHVDPLFRKLPSIAYLEVTMRFYGPAVGKPPVGGLDELYDAAFSLTAGIVHVCCNQKTQLLSIGPSKSSNRTYDPPGQFL